MKDLSIACILIKYHFAGATVTILVILNLKFL
jgi:hypothetical protein